MSAEAEGRVALIVVLPCHTQMIYFQGRCDLGNRKYAWRRVGEAYKEGADFTRHDTRLSFRGGNVAVKPRFLEHLSDACEDGGAGVLLDRAKPVHHATKMIHMYHVVSRCGGGHSRSTWSRRWRARIVLLYHDGM